MEGLKSMDAKSLVDKSNPVFHGEHFTGGARGQETMRAGAGAQGSQFRSWPSTFNSTILLRQ